MNTPRLETDRLILRKFTEDDLEMPGHFMKNGS